jgi:hypothetical protein
MLRDVLHLLLRVEQLLGALQGLLLLAWNVLNLRLGRDILQVYVVRRDGFPVLDLIQKTL